MKTLLNLFVPVFVLLIDSSPQPSLRAQATTGSKFEMWKNRLNCCMVFLPSQIVGDAFNRLSSDAEKKRLGPAGVQVLQLLFRNKVQDLEAVVVDFESKKIGVMRKGVYDLTPMPLTLESAELETLVDLVMNIATGKSKAIAIRDGVLSGRMAWTDAFEEYEKIAASNFVSEDTHAAVLGGLFHDDTKINEALARLIDFNPELHARCVALRTEFRDSSRVIDGTITKPIDSDFVTVFDGQSFALLRGQDAFLDADGNHIFDTSLDKALQLASKLGTVTAKVRILKRDGVERLASATLETKPDDNKPYEDLQFAHLFRTLPQAEKHRVAMAYAGRLRDTERVFERWDPATIRVAQVLTEK